MCRTVCRQSNANVERSLLLPHLLNMPAISVPIGRNMPRTPRVIKKVSEREFGVEIECGHRLGFDYVDKKLEEKGYRWRIGYDGDGVEVRTPKLKGLRGFLILRNTFKIL